MLLSPAANAPNENNVDFPVRGIGGRRKVVPMNELLERDAVLQTLHERLRSAATAGHAAWVAGEAGVGKTSVLRRLAADHPADAVWWGACDALQTPHPLAPLHDIGRDAGARFAAALGGPRGALFEAVLDELRFAVGPVLVVIEDAHWADDATLDFIKFLGRRIERTRALLAVSYRDDEVAASHPLRRVIGELPAALTTRIDLPRLSPAAVEQLARSASRSPRGLYAVTQGNPFFVTELLRHREDQVPRTVHDLVLARFARLGKPAQDIVRLASIVPARIERWLLDTLLAPQIADLEACVDSGLLLADASSLSFRHELARVAVENSLTPPLAQSLHAQVLAAIVAGGRGSPARLVHHAARAGDAPAVCRFAPAAAEQAGERGAHREAAAHWRTAMAHADTVDDPTRARWLDAYATESSLVARLVEAIDAREQLAQLLPRLGDAAREGDNLTRLAGLYVGALRNAEGDAMSLRAVALLETLPPGIELARAYYGEASLRMLNRDYEDSISWARKAIAVAEPLGERAVLAAARSVLGTAMMFIDYDAGCEQMVQAMASARELGAHPLVATTLLNLGSGSGELFRFAAAEPWLRDGVAFAASHELDSSALYATAWLALCALHRGRWDEAATLASEAIARADSESTTQVMALIALGRLRVRRGDPGTVDALDRALALADASGTLQRVAPVRAARAEAAFERGDLVTARCEAEAALPLALTKKHPWFIGELAYWCWRSGALQQTPDNCAAPFALQIAGRWREGAAAWAELGCPYERARALAEGDDAAQREALAIFDRLGARPAADALRRRLRDAGVRGVARGARPATRRQAFGLTARELEVLQLLCEGLRNAEIAARLCRSVRTVDHHLAAVFAKLGVDSRLGAIQAAERAGLAAQDGQASAPK